jgi:transcriptional regulator with XRE-family HTH domain
MKGPELDPMLRELRGYLALSYEADQEIAARIGITVVTLNGFLSGNRAPYKKTIAKIRAFLSAEARRNVPARESSLWNI